MGYDRALVNDAPHTWALAGEESPAFIAGWWTVFALLSATAVPWILWFGVGVGLVMACAVVVVVFAFSATITRGLCRLLGVRIDASLRLDGHALTWPHTAASKERAFRVDARTSIERFAEAPRDESPGRVGLFIARGDERLCVTAPWREGAEECGRATTIDATVPTLSLGSATELDALEERLRAAVGGAPFRA